MFGRLRLSSLLFLFIILVQGCEVEQIAQQPLSEKSEDPSNSPVVPDSQTITNEAPAFVCPEGSVPLIEALGVTAPVVPLTSTAFLADPSQCGLKPSIEKFNVPLMSFSDRDLTLELSASGTVTSLIMNPGQINLLGKSIYSFKPTASTSYTLYASNAYGTVSKTVYIHVKEAIEPVNKTDQSVCLRSNDLVVFKNTRLSSEFGIVANDGTDQSDKIQLAFDSLKAGERLLFGPGIYHHSKSLMIRKADVVIEGNSSDLRGTSADDQALMIQADNVVVRNFIITNFSAGRRASPASYGIAAYGLNAGQKIRNLKILNNVLVPVGGASLNYQSSGGLLIYNVEDYLVSGNLIARSAAESIHSTAKSKNGRILYNTILQGGGDGISIASYLDKSWRSKTNVDVNFLKNNYEASVASNIVVYKNSISGLYAGRGISVVGGKNISILNNVISKIFDGAGILVSRELSVESAGVNNLLVKENVISDIAVAALEFLPQGPDYAGVASTIIGGPISGHGGVEISALFSNADYAYPGAPDVLTTQKIQLEKNKIQNTKWDNVRIGAQSNHIQGINIIDNSVEKSGLGKEGFAFKTEVFDKNPFCVNNKIEGADFVSTFCSGEKNAVSGFMCYLP